MDQFASALGAAAVLGDQDLLLAILFVAVLLTVIGAAGLFGQRTSVERRLGQGASALAGGARAPISIRRRRRGSEAWRRFDHYLIPRTEKERTQVARRLAQAGFNGPLAVRGYYLVRAALGLGAPLALGLLAPVLSQRFELPTILMMLAGGGVAGFLLPSFVLDARARTRQRAIREGFPDALDMLLVCVEAGLGIDAALGRVAAEIEPAHPILADELLIVGLELRAGKARDVVLHDMAARIGVDEVSSFVTVLTQSTRFGTSIADAVRVYAADMRLRRLMRAEEMANRLPVKLSVVLVFCTLPAMFMVILGPGVIQIIRVLLPAMTQG